METNRRNQRQSKKSAARSTRTAIINEIMNASRTRKTAGPNDPGKTLTIKTTQKIDVILTGASVTLPTITATNILDSVTGNGTAIARGVFKKFRILKASLWNVAATTSTDKTTLSFLVGDTTQFVDEGVPGARAGAVHLLPSMFLAQQWLTDASGGVIRAQFDPTAQAVLHVTCELIST